MISRILAMLTGVFLVACGISTVAGINFDAVVPWLIVFALIIVAAALLKSASAGSPGLGTDPD